MSYCFSVDTAVNEQTCFISPSRVFGYPKPVIIRARHRLHCVSEQRSLLTEEFYLSVGSQPRFQSRKPGDLLYSGCAQPTRKSVGFWCPL